MPWIHKKTASLPHASRFRLRSTVPLPRLPPSPRPHVTSHKANGGGKGEGEDIPGGRILYVVSSFDRGQRLAPKFRGHDKLDFILMMMDEMREACEVRTRGGDWWWRGIKARPLQLVLPYLAR